MNKRLGERIRAEMERSGKASKAITLSTFERMAEELGQAADKHETVTGKFSKLLNDKPEGLAYFFATEHPVRLRALAHALGINVATLAEWKERDSVPTLVLDPRLPVEATRFIIAQADDRSAMYRVIAVEHPEHERDVDTAIRAEVAKHPTSIAVVATAETLRMFAFAQHAATTVHAVPRGYVLDAFPELVPIPPPAPPRIFDDSGLPVLPVEVLIAPRGAYESFAPVLDEIERRVFEPAKQRGDVPCLSVKDAIAWNTRDAGPLVPRRTGSHGNKVAPVELVPCRSFQLAQLVGDENASTLVWIDGNRIFAIGPHLAQVAAVFAPHHIVTEPEDVTDLRRRIAEDHPWQLLEDAERPDDTLNHVLKDLRSWVEARQAKCIDALVIPKRDEIGRLLSDDESPSRDRLRELSEYGIEAGRAALLLALARAADAPLVLFEAPESKNDDVLALLADLGGGHLLRLRTKRMPGRRTHLKERAIRRQGYGGGHLAREFSSNETPSTIYDGGDVLLSVQWINEVTLEGWSLPARRRRAHRRRDDEDDES